MIPDIPYNADPSLITLNAFAGEALKKLSDAGFMLMVVSNQSGIAKGYFDISQLEVISTAINRLLKAYEVSITQFYYCPHLKSGRVPEFSFDCSCRKPLPGLITAAIREFDVDAGASWMIGDILNDCEAGKRAGCQTILLDNGNETEWLLNTVRQPDYTVTDLMEAAMIICSNQIPTNQHEPGWVLNR